MLKKQQLLQKKTKARKPIKKEGCKPIRMIIRKIHIPNFFGGGEFGVKYASANNVTKIVSKSRDGFETYTDTETISYEYDQDGYPIKKRIHFDMFDNFGGFGGFDGFPFGMSSTFFIEYRTP